MSCLKQEEGVGAGEELPVLDGCVLRGVLVNDPLKAGHS
ncbi:hypothetical protein AVEN_238549-1, partial [Araneus ventricosus]